MGQRFDDLSKAFAQGKSRRTALRGFIAGMVGGLVGLVVPGAAQPALGLAGGNACVRYCLTLRGEQRTRCFAVAPSCPNGCVYFRGGVICT